MALAKYVLLLPLHYNDGRPVSAPLLDRYLNDLFLLARGYTVVGKVSGAYQMRSGQKQIDRCMQIWVVVDQARERRLKRWLSRVAAELGQESMYLERTGGVVSFIKATKTAEPDDENKNGRDT